MASAEHCIYCFDSLATALERRDNALSLSKVGTLYKQYKASNNSTPPSSTASLQSSNSSQLPLVKAPAESPLFVTWNITDDGEEYHLRGCIGTFEAQELSAGLNDYAHIAAFEDHRFSPISLKELPRLEVNVTLLTDFETAESAMEWELGVHGIRISFMHQGRRHGSCYLPSVATDQGWNKEETMVSLLRKGGWNGRSADWRNVQDLKVTRFQGKKCELGYEEYKEFKDWVDSLA